MKIAITGATGFVGQHLLTEALNRGHDVTAIVRDPGKITATNRLNLIVEQADIFNVEKLAGLIQGHDAVLSAYNSGWDNPNIYDEFITGSKAIQNACLKAGVKRLLIIGGAGSLKIEPGKQLVDMPDFPVAWKTGALAARDYFNMLQNERDLEWTYLSPAIEMHPGTSGVRTGNYRKGTNEPVFNDKGESKISVEDTAVALLDETEKPHYIRKRFTVAW